MLAAPFRPLYKNIKPTVSLPFLERLPIPVIFPVARYKSNFPIRNFFNFFLKDHSRGVPDTTTIFQDRADKSFICCFFYIFGALIKISSQEAKCIISLCTHVANMSIPSQVMCDGHVKVFNGIHIFKDRSLLSVISLCFVCSFPSYLHNRGVSIQYFHIYAWNMCCWYSLEAPRRGSSNEYPQSICWAEIWKISDFFYLKLFIFCW